MLGRTRKADHDHDTVPVGDDPGISLARGPALLIGAILAGFGLALFLQAGDTPTGAFPDGTVQGETFLGFETNGWTAWITTAAGVLLLFGAAKHLLARTMAFVVGAVLAWAAIVAAVDGDDVYGLAAANGWTALGWGATAVVLLLVAMAPRRGRRRDRDHVDGTPVVAHRDTDRRHHTEDRDLTPDDRDPHHDDGTTDPRTVPVPDRSPVAHGEEPTTTHDDGTPVRVVHR